MKSRVVIQGCLLVAFVLFVALMKQWLSLKYLPFLYGAVLGTLLPLVDHLFYVYILHPDELTSQRVRAFLSKGNLVSGTKLLASTFLERTNLVLHTAHFQLLFLAVAFLIVTSGASIFGRGIVFAVLLHLVVDQIIELNEKGNLDNWFKVLPFNFSKSQQVWFVGVNLLLLFIFALVL